VSESAEHQRERRKKNPEKARESARKWARNNKSKVNANSTAWRLANPERTRANQKAWRAKNREKSRAYGRKGYAKNPEKGKERSRKYRKLHPDKASAATKRWYKNNKDKVNIGRRKYLDKNLDAKIADRLRCRIRYALKAASNSVRITKSESTLKLLGCSMGRFGDYITAHFSPGMSWNNYGEWEIDHIKPCASFDLTDDEQQRQCFHFTNLQPLWMKENRSKHCRTDWGRNEKK
jgi:hypothetical protein